MLYSKLQTTNKDSSPHLDLRIINGDQAKYTPFMVSLQYAFGHPCEDKIDHGIVCKSDQGVFQHAHVVDIPYSVGDKHIHICGGSILDARFIVTAAHCLDGKNLQDFSIVAGTRLLNETTNFNRYCLKRKIIHDIFSPRFAGYDIALVEISRAFSFIPNKVESIAFNEQRVDSDDDLTMFG